MCFSTCKTVPPSNAYLSEKALNEPEVYYPLKVYTCDQCFLVQVDEYKKAQDIFNEEYAYFSSYSKSWLQHASSYVEMMCQRFGYNQHHLVVEIASNDGYLLQYFKERNVPVLGVEPTLNTAEVAINKGIECITEYFGEALAQKEFASKSRKSDLIIGNNVLAHVPDIMDFVKGISIALKPDGIVTMEFPHLLQLIENNQFDTIYHEHFSYLSFTTVQAIFSDNDLVLFDVEEIATHGGSLRIFARHKDNSQLKTTTHVQALLDRERETGLTDLQYYKGFAPKAEKIRFDFLQFLIHAKRENKKTVAYGAAAKGNTLLNYCGVKRGLIDYVVDASPHKQGKFLPGSRIPIVSEERIREDKPDYVVIFPWNIKDEIIQQLDYCREWGAQFVMAIPELTIA